MSSSAANSNSRTKFREHLSIKPTSASDMPHNVDIEISRFSPESPPPPFRSPSPRSYSPIMMAKSFRSGRSTMGNAKERDIEAAASSPHPSSLKDRLTRFVFDSRAFSPGIGRDTAMSKSTAYSHSHSHSRSHSDSRTLSEWPPLRVSKHQCSCPHNDNNNNRKRRWALVVLFLVVLLYLLVSSTFSLVRVISLPASLSSTTSTSTTSTTTSLNVQQCISQYTLNAPASPASYPCSTCLPLLSSLPQSALSALSPSDAQSQYNAVQFCALRAIFDSADQVGQSTLSAASGWFVDVKFCAWIGVTCDSAGRVSALQLAFPGVPAALPAEIGGLMGLRSLQVIGDGVVPGGSVPASFATNLTGVTTLHLESTALTALPNDLFVGMKNMGTLQLIKNGAMGSTLPSSLFTSAMKNLIINSQPLDSNTLQSISSSPSLQSSLQLLDLSATSLSTTLPSNLSSLSSLTELHVDSASIQPPLPGAGAFPHGLQVLSLSNNPALAGGSLGGVCGLTTLNNCSLSATGLSAPAGGCGVCVFS